MKVSYNLGPLEFSVFFPLSDAFRGAVFSQDGSGILPSSPPGTLGESADIFGGHNWEGVPGIYRGGQNAPQYPTMHSTARQQRIVQPRMQGAPRWRNPDVNYYLFLMGNG